MSDRPVQRTQRRRSGTCPAASAITRWARVSYDAAVLDLGLPDGDGLAVLATLEQMMRRFGRIIPKAVLEEKLYGMDEEPDRMDHQAGICNCASCRARFDLRFRPV
jgi:CheY-like chemotaxis protein